MLKLKDFLHLPQIDSLISELVADSSGMIILAGIQARPVAEPGRDSFSPSGLSALLNIMIQEILLDQPLCQAVFITENRALARVPRQITRRVRILMIDDPSEYGKQIEIAAKQRPGLLIVDKLTEETAPAAFEAAHSGLRVLSQMDTVLKGALTGQQLMNMGVSRERLSALHWVFTNQRMPVLCNHCKKPIEATQELLERVCLRYPHLKEKVASKDAHAASDPSSAALFYRAAGCEQCHSSGYSGDIAVFDIFRNDPQQVDFFAQSSRLSFEEYAFMLAKEGLLDLDHLLNLDSDFLRQTYQMFTTSQQALTQANTALNRKLFELEATNRVLVQRTEVLMSLQDLGQSLIESTDLSDLATRVCRRAGDLSGADRVVLYLREEIGEDQFQARILATRGWRSNVLGQVVDADAVFSHQTSVVSSRMTNLPPGMEKAVENERFNKAVLVGLYVPLYAQEQMVGAMVVQSTQKDHITPGELAVLKTFANQAALAIQRAGLVDALRSKITQLEEAQAELVKKERMEHELDLARQVQQSLLPTDFPKIPGFHFAAHNEPARQVGGDFYDFFVLDDHHFGIVIADVADKGMPAALYMALSRSLILAEARRVASPRQVLLNVNRLLLELGDLNGFVSVFYGVVEYPARQLRYVRAGHDRPLLYRQGQLISLGGEGVVLGILENEQIHLTEETFDLSPDDRLVLFTDGLTDVINDQESFSGLAVLKKILLSNGSSSADEICRLVFEELGQYRGQADQFDDMTLLVLHVD